MLKKITIKDFFIYKDYLDRVKITKKKTLNFLRGPTAKFKPQFIKISLKARQKYVLKKKKISFKLAFKKKKK